MGSEAVGGRGKGVDLGFLSHAGKIGMTHDGRKDKSGTKAAGGGIDFGFVLLLGEGESI
ncbi:MAG: hypothetical protein LBR92_03655 [Puniceicoccales bacterium]|nr:hypothetical protein [Puniceicoccales bacterium]